MALSFINLILRTCAFDTIAGDYLMACAASLAWLMHIIRFMKGRAQAIAFGIKGSGRRLDE